MVRIFQFLFNKNKKILSNFALQFRIIRNICLLILVYNLKCGSYLGE